MPLLALKADKAPRWVEALDGNWENGNFPYEVLREFVSKGGGVSVWRVNRKRDSFLGMLAAAFEMKSNRHQFEKVRFQLINESDAINLGIEIRSTEGELFSKGSVHNKQHFDLCNLTGIQVVKLARLFKNSSREFKAAEVAFLVARYHLNGTLPELQNQNVVALEKFNKISVVMRKKKT